VLQKIPGFRSGRKRNKVFAVIGYLLFLMGLLIGIGTGTTGWDSFINALSWTLLFFGFLLLFANLYGIRQKFYLLNRTSLKGRIFGYLGYVLACLLIFGVITSFESDTAKAKSAERAAAYNAAQEAKQQAEAATKAKSEEEAKVKAEQAAANKRISAKVIEVVDGDTIKVDIQGKTETVRFLLVDTPETKHPDKGVQPFGPEASSFTKDLLTGKDVELEKDVSERDKYGRLLFYVYVNGKSVEEMLLEKGLARVAVYPPDVKYVDQYRAIQDQARQSGVGIWSIENYARDDGYHPEVSNKSSVSSQTQPAPAQPAPSQPAPSHPVAKSGPGPHGETIKGNINSKGEKIYHVPGGQFYDKTNPEAWFFTEAEAQAAGYRASKR
jgi:micrococcal nuclease